MKKLEYLDTAKGQSSLKLYRDIKRIYIDINQEPKSKKSIKQEEIDFFQEQVLKQLRKRRNFRDGIVLFLLFNVKGHSSAPIQTLAKNYIDLLGLNKNSNRKYLLFKDDNQIDVLIVGCHKSEDRSGIHIQAQSISNFIKDLNLLHKIKYGYFTDYGDIRYEYVDDDRLKYNDDDDDLDLWSLKQLDKNKEENIKKRGVRRFNEMRDFYVGNFQKKGLNNFFSLNVLVDLFREHFVDSNNEKQMKEILKEKGRHLNDLEDNLVRMLFKSNLSLNVGTLPNKTGDKLALKKQIDLVLKNLLEKKSFLKNLRVPLKITLIVTQRGNKYSNKDLDNIMKDYIIPKIVEKFNPKFIGLYEVINLKSKNKKYLQPGEMRLFLSEYTHGFDNIWRDLDSKIDDRENSF